MAATTTDTTHDTAARAAMFTVLGTTNGSAYTAIYFLLVTLVAVLRENGASLSQIAAITATGVLFSVKFLWAPLLDRFGSRRGHYRSWLLVVQPLVVVAAAMLLGVDPVGHHGLLVVVVAAIVQLVAVQDVAADALAVRVLAVGDRALGSGIRHTGSAVGHVLGGGAILWVYGQWGWAAAVVTLTVCTAVPLWPLLRFTEPPPRATPRQRRPGYASMVTIFREPFVARWTLVLLPLSWMGMTCGHALVTPMLVDAGWAAGQVALVVGVLASVAAAVASLLLGWVVRRVGRRRALVGFGVLQALSLLSLLVLAGGVAPYAASAVAVVCGFNAVHAGLSVVINVVLMDLSRPATAGSDFTVLSSVGLLVALGSGAVGLAAADQVGYGVVLAVAAGVAVVGTVVNLFFFRGTVAGGT